MDKKQKALDFMRGQKYCTLCTSVGDVPHSAYMMFIVEDDLKMYFLMRPNTEKFKNIEANPNVAVNVTDEEKLRQIQYQGVAKVLEGKSYYDWLNFYLDKIQSEIDDGLPPLLKLKGVELNVIEVEPRSVKFGDFKQAIEIFDVVVA